MPGQATIGVLRAIFGADTAAFEKGVDTVDRKIKRTQKNFARFGRKLTGIGKAMSIGITAPLLALGATSFNAGIKHREAMAQVEAGVSSMGGASGKSAKDLKRLALGLESLSGFNADEVLKKVTANMLTFGNVADEQFDRAQMAVLDLSTRMDQDLKSSTILVGKALNDPIAGLSALSRVGITFTDTQKDMIKEMVTAGDTAGAQKIVLKELERQYGGSAKAARDAAPGSQMQDIWRKFQRIIGEFIVQVLPPLTKLLGGVLKKFNDLSPKMQRIVVVSAAILAAIGPVVTIVGVLTTILAPLTAAIVVVTGATTGLGAAMTIALGPIGLVIVAIGVLTAAYITFSPAIRDNKKARDELYAVISENEKLLKQEKATTLEGAKSQLIEAQAIRENMQARLESQKVLLKKQIKGFSRAQASPLGIMFNKRMAHNITETGQSIKASTDAISKNAAAQALLTAQIAGFNIEERKRKASIDASAKALAEKIRKEGENTAALERSRIKAVELAAVEIRLADERIRLADEQRRLTEAHNDTVSSIEDEIENNAKLVEALRISQEEYEITAALIAVLEGSFSGTAEEARKYAERLVSSRRALRGVQTEMTKIEPVITDLGDKFGKFGDTGSSAFDSILQSFDTLVAGLKSGDLGGILGGIFGVLQNSGIFGGSGKSGGISSILGGIFGGKSSGGQGITGIQGIQGITGILQSGIGALFKSSNNAASTTSLRGASRESGNALSSKNITSVVEITPSPYFDARVVELSAGVSVPISAKTMSQGFKQAARIQATRKAKAL